MKITITARHFKAKDTLQEYINEKLEELEKYDENIIYAEVILSYEGTPNDIKYCEILLKVRDELLVAKEQSDDFAKAVDLTVEKIDAQLYKYHDKHKNHKSQKHINKDIFKTE